MASQKDHDLANVLKNLLFYKLAYDLELITSRKKIENNISKDVSYIIGNLKSKYGCSLSDRVLSFDGFSTIYLNTESDRDKRDISSIIKSSAYSNDIKISISQGSRYLGQYQNGMPKYGTYMNFYTKGDIDGSNAYKYLRYYYDIFTKIRGTK